MPKLIIDGKEHDVPAGYTIIQACEQAGIEIPRFCYHEKLKIAGNCRMCLVEVEKMPKPVASCAMPVADNMVVHTNTPIVKNAREGVMEFLLINHPLDCPICDQGGECDLQDQAMAYGRGENRFHENKRAILDKYMGPLIETHMTRCIHCTRCVRFITDIAGIEELGAINRGEHMEITTYVEKSLTSELSGNIIDVCPVGALTSKPYAFKARAWELKKTESIDVLDAVGSNIRVDSRGLEVMRILPRLNEEINEEWISDKTRFAYDGLKLQRLDRPMIKKNGRLAPVSWQEALKFVADKIKITKSDRMAAIVGDLTDCETITALKDLMNELDCYATESRQEGAKFDVNDRASYLFNTTINGIEEADLCLLIGADPKIEAAMLNAKIRKRFLSKQMPIASIGPVLNHNYDVEELGNDLNILIEILEGKHPYATRLANANKPMIIIGESVYANNENALNICRQIADKYLIKENWNGYNILHKAAARVGALDLKFVQQDDNLAGLIKKVQNKEIELVYLAGVDELDLTQLSSSMIIYQGHHGDKGAHMADVILPGAAYTEKNATYVNMEGRVQQTKLAVLPPGQAREDWQIIKMIADELNLKLSYNNLQELRHRMVKIAPHFAYPNQIDKAEWKASDANNNQTLEDSTIRVNSFNYYMTDPISRASKTMAACTNFILNEQEAA